MMDDNELTRWGCNELALRQLDYIAIRLGIKSMDIARGERDGRRVRSGLDEDRIGMAFYLASVEIEKELNEVNKPLRMTMVLRDKFDETLDR